ncbi:hypothetical protein P8452_42765 [Trifolium repens]|nr:hypothetical protein P8452_42765 [Trifolium repens]
MPPSDTFENVLPRHYEEFIRCLPFQEYCDPQAGILNLATKLPPRVIKPDLGPKTYLGYGIKEELGRGESVTKLHCDMADAIDGNYCPNKVSSITKETTKIGGGALWDIFRREDTKKLEAYLRKHSKEFRHIYCSPVKQVAHPIHDQCFYLTLEHKKKLKEEFDKLEIKKMIIYSVDQVVKELLLSLD